MSGLSAEAETELRELAIGLERNLTKIRRPHQLKAMAYGYFASLFLHMASDAVGFTTKGGPWQNRYVVQVAAVLTLTFIWCWQLQLYKRENMLALSTLKDAKKHLGK